MKLIKEGSRSLIAAAAELTVGVLLLLNPAGFTSGIVIGLGVLLIASGLIAAAQYFAAKPEEAARQQGLSKGLVLVIIGAFCALYADALIALFPLLTMFYGLLLLILSAAKVQVAVDMLRLKRPNWQWAAGSALVSVLLSAVVLINPFETTAVVFMLMAIALITEAVLDVLAVFFKRRTPMPPANP